MNPAAKLQNLPRDVRMVLLPLVEAFDGNFPARIFAMYKKFAHLR